VSDTPPPAPITPVRAADATWLNLDRPDNPLVIDALLLMQAGADIPAIIDRFVNRVVLTYPRFRQVVEAHGVTRTPVWRAVELNLDDHLHEARIADPGRREDLWDTIGELLDARLELSRPLWSLTVIRGLASGEVLLLFRAHHVIGDGMAMAQILLSVADEDDVPMPRPRGRIRPAGGDWTDRIIADLDTGVDAMRAATELLSMSPDPPSILSGPLAGTKRFAWSEPTPLALIQAIRSQLGGTVNDVLVSAVAGALNAMGGEGVMPDVHALVPVYLRPLHEPIPRDLGNHFAPVFLRLPSRVADPAQRLERVRARSEALKNGQMPLVGAVGVQAMGFVPRLVEAAAVDFFATRASLVLTNVPGPTDTVHVVGARIEDMVFFVPQPSSIGVGLSLFSYNGQVRMGVSVDAARDIEPSALATAFTHALIALAAQAEQHATDRSPHEST